MIKILGTLHASAEANVGEKVMFTENLQLLFLLQTLMNAQKTWISVKMDSVSMPLEDIAVNVIWDFCQVRMGKHVKVILCKL